MSDKYAVPNKLPGKTVSILAHRKRRILQDKATLEQKKALKTKRVASAKRHHKFRRPESFVMNYLKAERTANRIKRTIHRTNLVATKDADKTNKKLLLVMRHAGKKIFDPTTDKIFNTLHMPNRHNAVFLKNDKETQILLKVIEPFVIYGYPSLSTIRELLFKRGFARVNIRKTPIQSNTLVEEHLGDKGIICLEDIIHEIYTVGPNFDAVKEFLCSFMLSSPREGWKKKVSVPYKRGGEYGDRGDAINELIMRCI
ncbi:60S ribosomal protein L7-like [Rhagoletis pomonella]|uniref:60S ribosomal protein L7-like n=1 Tax=Rhagoletis pomonella TaxID=28610 RepID=UPI001780256D|nr:60S ribosomal protein L7-like [Rhagoletis pomonella]